MKVQICTSCLRTLKKPERVRQSADSSLAYRQAGSQSAEGEVKKVGEKKVEKIEKKKEKKSSSKK